MKWNWFISKLSREVKAIFELALEENKHFPNFFTYLVQPYTIVSIGFDRYQMCSRSWPCILDVFKLYWVWIFRLFVMYYTYGHVHAIPTYRVYQFYNYLVSDMRYRVSSFNSIIFLSNKGDHHWVVIINRFFYSFHPSAIKTVLVDLIKLILCSIQQAGTHTSITLTSNHFN